MTGSPVLRAALRTLCALGAIFSMLPVATAAAVAARPSTLRVADAFVERTSADEARAWVVLVNDGPLPCAGATGILSVDAAAVREAEVTLPVAGWPEIEPHTASAPASFGLRLAGDVACGAQLALLLDVDDGAGRVTLPFTARIGQLGNASARRVGDVASGTAGLGLAPLPAGAALAFRDAHGAAQLALLDHAGRTRGTVTIDEAAAGAPWPAWGGGQLGVAYVRAGSAAHELVLAFFDASGNVLRAPVRVAGASARGAVRLAWNDALAQWGVTWTAPGGELQFARLAADGRADGAPLGAGPRGCTGAPSLAAAGERWAMAWSSTCAHPGLEIALAGASGGWSAGPFRAGRGGRDGDVALVAAPGGGFVLLHRVVDGAGVVLQAAQVDPATGLVSVRESVAASTADTLLAAADGAGLDAAWIDASAARTLRLARLAGGAADPAGDAVGPLAGAPRAAALARLAGARLVAWTEPGAESDTLWVRPLAARFACGSVPNADGPAPANAGSAPAIPLAPSACGDRWVAPGGTDAPSDCTVQGAPCGSIHYAASVACAGDTVRVAEGTYTENVVINQPINVTNTGITVNTQVVGTGTTDVVQILAGGATWNGIEIGATPGHACLRIGDAAHPGLRDVQITNAAMHGCRTGVIVDSTGTGGWNRLLGCDVRESVADGTSTGGVGVLVTGGNGRLEIKTGLLRDNGGPGLRVDAAPVGGSNESIVVAGENVFGNGFAANAPGRAAIEIHATGDARLEGNYIHDNVGVGAPDDGRGVLLDAVTSANFFCNRLRANERGLMLTGGAAGVDIEQNQFVQQLGAAVWTDAGALGGVTVDHNIFQGNATAVHNDDGAVTLDATRSWWGAASGPAPGGGDPVSGLVDTSQFIPRAAAPVFARRPADSGWDPSPDSCFQQIQAALDYSAVGGLVVVGPGAYYERVTLSKKVDIQGAPAGSGCPPSEVYGEQANGSHVPVMVVSGVTGMSMSNMTFRNASHGTPCGAASGDEIGLDLHDVSSSTFSNLCLLDNGVTELRLFGASSGNTFTNLTVDGMYRQFEGHDLCGHRSREGILVDGGPACLGGPGAIASGNHFTGGTITNVARGVSLQLADSTTVSGFTIAASQAAAWNGGTYATSVLVGLGDNNVITNNVMGSVEQNDGVRVTAKAAGSCIAERTDTHDTTISGNTISNVLTAGIRNYRTGADPGYPRGTTISCNTLVRNANGVVTDFVGTSPGPVVTVHGNDFRQNTTGLRNIGVDTLDASGNWWNSLSGPGGAGPGTGDAVFGGVSFSPWLKSSGSDDADGDGYTECGGDCDDTNGSVHPGAAEACDNADNNCNGQVDEGLPTFTYHADADGDGFGATLPTLTTCAVTPPAGWALSSNDCDDADASISPAAIEVCTDNRDNNCNGLTDGADAACANLVVNNLRFGSGSKSTLTWDTATGASMYALLRGSISTHGMTGYDHSCAAGQLGAATAVSAELPPPGSAFYYIASAQTLNGTTGAITSGPLGQGANNAWRPDSATLSCGPRVFVNAAATGANNGGSWTDAYTSIQAALAHAKAADRGLEIWVRGNLSGTATLAAASRPGAKILAGFAGTETLASQRNPALNPSTWTGTANNPLVTFDHTSGIVDGFTLATGSIGVRSLAAGQRVEVLGTTLSGFTQSGIDVTTDGNAGTVLRLENNTLDAAGQRGLRLFNGGGTVSGTVRNNTFAGGSEAALRLDAHAGATPAIVDLSVVRNRVNGGAIGVLLGAYANDGAGAAVQRSVVASNVITGTSGPGVRVEANGNFLTLLTAASARAVPRLVGNTISGAAGDGIACVAMRTDSSGASPLHEVRSAPELWDNLITFATAAAISETADNTANGLVADPLVVGNDLFGNGSLYLDEGGNTLGSITAVNQLAGARDNYTADPLYVNRVGGNYHVGAGSPAIDKGHADAPGLAGEDMDGACRIKGAAPDTGADETP